MGKKIGNRSILFLLMFAQFIFSNITLRIKNDKTPIAGKPFVIEVVVDSARQFGSHPTIRGLDSLVNRGIAQIIRTSMHIGMIHGNTTATYSYEVVITKPQTYKIGPAIFPSGNNNYISNTITLNVAQAGAQAAQDNAKSEKESSIFLRFFIDKETAFVGERVPCRLRLYFTDTSLSLKQLLVQEAKQFSTKQFSGPVTGVEKLNGTSFNYAEWSWDLYSNESGAQVIPAYGVDYEKRVEQRRDHFWGGLGRLFGNHYETKRVYSNAASIKVNPLPKHDKPIQAIGSFSYIHLSAQPSVVKQGEGMVVTVEVAGDADMEKVTISSLQGVPSELRYYESKQSVLEPKEPNELYKKRFEFVVQGLKTGSWEIPAQSLHYFDVEKHAFKTIQSAPLAITIMPGIKTTTSTFSNNTPTPIQESSIAGLHENGPWFPAPKKAAIPWWIIGFIMILPIILLILRGMLLHHKKRNKISYATLRASHAFSNARKRLGKIHSTKQSMRLYSLFIELMADRCKTSLGVVTAPFITLKLQEVKVSDTIIQQWNQFFETITERAYGASTNQTDEQLIDEAEKWITEFQKIL